ncbi:MAG: family efflux transporter [Hyphomicrobiales bacterium]|nr:family efflux transporter [Hyphomicrobiales bacterium]
MVPGMTDLDRLQTLEGSPAPASPLSLARAPWRREVSQTLALAWPMALTQVGQIAMMTTDLAMLGRLGDGVMAGAALAHTVMFAAFVLGMGLVSAVAPLASQAYGAGDREGVRAALRVGLWIAAIVGAPLSLAQLWGRDLLVALGQEPQAATLAARYLEGLAWSLAPGWAFIAIRGFMGAVNRPQPALWIMLGAVPLNALLCYGLIHGAFGLPSLDLLGAGLATTIVSAGMCAVALWVAYVQEPFRAYRPLRGFWRWDWTLMRAMLVIGAPISASFLLEYGLFAVTGLLMGHIGVRELAAHQVALQTAAILFMAPFGISMAATVRVGHAFGRGDAAAARLSGFVALGLSVIFMSAMTLAVVAFRDLIPHAFLAGATAPETLALASLLLLVGTSFFIFDGVQTVAAGALRGLGDTRTPLVFAAVSFWGLGFIASYGFGFPAGLGAPGVWIGLTLGLGLFSLLLVWRFERLTRPRPRLAATVGD